MPQVKELGGWIDGKMRMGESTQVIIEFTPVFWELPDNGQ